MKVLVGTLMQQGQVYGNFHQSIVQAFQQSLEEKFRIAQELTRAIPNFDPKNPQHQADFNFSMNAQTLDLGEYTLGGESLISRGRNHMAQVALTQHFDKIIFIDADEGFTLNDIKALAFSNYPIAAGLVPLKTYPIPNSFETVLNFLPFLKDEPFFDDSLRTLKGAKRLARAQKSDWIEVAYTGTGFLCIDVSVFAKLAETTPEYAYPNPATGITETHWSFFDGGPMHDQYFSEDWTFCQKARDAGFKIMVNTKVLVNHQGPHMFKP